MRSTIAIVGRPNVGKSTIFNRCIGSRLSIVEDEPGVTRDRIYGTGTWLNKEFHMIDTGGIQLEDQPYQNEIRAQVQVAVQEADVILFVTDGTVGVTDDDRYIAQMLHRSKKPIVLAVNHIDDSSRLASIYEFYSLGVGDPIAVSGVHGVGVGDVLDACFAAMPKEEAVPEPEGIRIAVIGQPNVGKSSLVNAILNQERAIVANEEGTTRDAVDTAFQWNGRPYVIVDTAGIRKRGRVYENIEKYSVMRAMQAIERCDVALFLMDACLGIREQDKHVAGYAHDAGKPVIIVVNKWDAIEKDDKTTREFEKKIRTVLSFAPYASILFLSAKTGQRLPKLFDAIDAVLANQTLRIQTGVLNELLTEAVMMQQPPSDKGRRLRIYYMTQVAVKPPTFVLFVNDKQLMHFSYLRYLENQIRESFGFSGTALRMLVRERKEKDN